MRHAVRYPAPLVRSLVFSGIGAFCLLACFILSARAGGFSGTARLEVTDPTGALSWGTNANGLTVQCWFKFSVPSGTNLTENMTILVNRRGGSQSDPHAYLLYYNILTGSVEFSARGSGLYTNTLIVRPYLDRWYHVAVVRQAETYTAYVDGRQIFSGTGSTGNAATTDGLSVGGWGNGKYLYGEVQEVSVYQAALSQDYIIQYMFAGQPTDDPTLGLKGYFPFGYSTITADELRNFAPAPVPSGTDSASQKGTAQVTFEEVNQAGEQSAFDAQRNGGRDALTPLSGAFSWQQTAFARPTPGVAMDLRFGYSSANSFGGFLLGGSDPYSSGPMGRGWRHSFETRVIPSQTFSPFGDADSVGLMRWDGSIETWDLNYDAGEYETRSQEYRGELVITTTNCQWTTPERLVYIFRRPDSGANLVMRGRLASIRNFNGNSVQVLWNETSGVITQVVDSAAGSYNFRYQSSLLTNIGFGQWQLNFAYDSTNRLTSKTLTNTSGLYTNVAATWRFQYDTNSLLARIIDPRGNTNILVQYDQYGRQTNQVDALGRSAATRYASPGKRQITRIDSGTNSWVETYDRKGHILAQQDPVGNVTSYTYDLYGNRTSATEPLGWTTLFGYDDRANVVVKTNALGEVTRWVFHPFFNKAIQEINALNWTNFYAYDAGGNLTNQADDLGALVRYTYSTNGLVLASTDANGNITRFGYDTNGFLITQTDAATNTTTFTRNETGWKLAELDPLGRRTAYSYDLNGNLVLTVDPIFRQFTKTYDANGNLLSASDAKANLTRYGYDPANQKTNMVDRTGTNVWQYFYTSCGKLERLINPLGFTVTNFYDAANRLVRVSDPLGNTSTNVLDANGNITTRFDPLGQRWTKTYDRLNRVISEADPQGDMRQTSFDVAGRLKTITSPNGFVTTHEYDGRGRLIKWHDPEGFDWLYAYDGNANITNITDALGGRYIMAYGPRNERTLERNQDNKSWQYAYDELLRLKSQTDPSTLTRTVTYDAAGRIQTVDVTSGRQDTYDHDDNNNLKVLTRRVAGVPTTSRFNYDLLDRVTQVTDPFFKTVGYGYDALGRVASLTYPDGKALQQNYDALNRLTNQVDWAGRTVNYAYDSASRLIRRAYPNGVVQTDSFDNVGRVTSLSYAPSTSRSNSVNAALTYAYDRNGNKTGCGERGTFAWPMPSLVDETSRFTPAGRITNRLDALNPANNFTYQYDASGNMINASGGGQTWALTYDEDNRTTSVHWQVLPLTDKLITNRYDALGRRVSRTLDAVETRYVLDLQGSMERIICDTDAAGTITAWYIHGPDLCYKVDATNGLTCFHADAQANVIAVTDGGTNLVAQYAYTPYGRSLGSTNFQAQLSNPYLFVGSQGVMEEVPGVYFMRARYYSAETGVFLSTDQIKKIGPGWKPTVYTYSDSRPLALYDPSGQSAIQDLLSGTGEFVLEAGKDVLKDTVIAAAAGAKWAFNQGYKDLPSYVGAVEGTVKVDMGGVRILNSVAGAGVTFGVERLIDKIEGGKHQSFPGVGFIPGPVGTYLSIFLYARVLDDAEVPAGYYDHGPVDYYSTTLPNSGQSGGVLQSIASRTATIAAPRATATTSVNSTRPTGASRGDTTSGGAGSAPGSGSTTYTVRTGDTLGNIAYANHTTVSAIATASGIQNVNLIHPGQVVTIRH